MNPAEKHRKRGIRIGVIVVGVLIVIALSNRVKFSVAGQQMAITGPISMLNAKLASFDFGSKLSAGPSLVGQQTLRGVHLSKTPLAANIQASARNGSAR